MKNKPCPQQILVVSKQPQIAEQLCQAFQPECAVFSAHTHTEITSRLEEGIAVVVAEQNLLDVLGENVLEFASITSPETLWILLTARAEPDLCSRALKSQQVYAYRMPPWHPDEICLLVKRALEHTSLVADHHRLLEQSPQEQVFHHLVQSEKMVALGKMMAEISHEINSPSGAINAAIVNIHHHLKTLIEHIGELDKKKISRKDAQQILKIVTDMIDSLYGSQRRRSSEEVRAEQKRVAAILEQRGIPNVRNLAKQIARMDLSENLNEVLALAARYDTNNVLMLLTDCHRVITSAHDIRVSSDMLTRILRALKTYSYPKQEKPELANIHDSLETALTILNNKLKRSIHVEWQRGNIPNIWCYNSELSHVWLNLLLNSIQAIDGAGNILIETFATKTYLGVRITDSGQGIPTEIQEQIFDVNFTTKSQGEGSGLGLYIAHQIIERHGGTITVDSIPGKTIFEVHLPLNLPE